MEELLIVTTGGTIDKVYFDDKSDYQVGEPQIGRILQELGVAFAFNVIPILRKDSLHINAGDRELLRATISAQPARHVLVTHGTDTMVETAQVLASIVGKTIVLTGALNPARFRGSGGRHAAERARATRLHLCDGCRSCPPSNHLMGPARCRCRSSRIRATRPGRIRRRGRRSRTRRRIRTSSRRRKIRRPPSRRSRIHRRLERR